MGPITYTFEALKKMKDENMAPASVLETLRRKADEILESPTINVTQNPILPASGNPHDYFSMGPYWWPNPNTPNGLPYIRKDGEVNPERDNLKGFWMLDGRIHILALAAFYFDDVRYAAYASRQLYDWFINPDTCMTPHARYAQAVPGVADGRIFGMMDFSESYRMLDGIGILESMGVLDRTVSDGVRAWYVQFTDWMLTHEFGMEEDINDSNQGAWYSAQLLTAAVFTNRPMLAKRIIHIDYDRRIRGYIRPDGSMPSELHRTKAIHYTVYALRAFMVLSAIAEQLGDDRYWGLDPERGTNILKSAVDYIYPYAVDLTGFPYQEIYPDAARKSLSQILVRTDVHFPGEGYAEKAAPWLDDTMLWRLEPHR